MRSCLTIYKSIPREALIYYLNRQGRQERQEFSVVIQPHFLGVLGALGGLKVFSEVL
jgi:hypothetical protein